MASKRYKQLEGRFRVLRRVFLPKRFSSTGTYGADALDRARAFRVLMHAEIESYLEDRAGDIAEKAFVAWNSGANVSLTLAALLASFAATEPGFPQQVGTKPFVRTRVGHIVAQFRETVRGNHGIRQRHVLALLLPIGIEETKIDPGWLGTTDGFGSARGEAAHMSGMRSRVKYAIDPQSDFQTVKQILLGLERIDAELTQVANTIRK